MHDSNTKEGRFKNCSSCVQSWASRDLFLHDPLLKIIGYQVNFDYLEMGLFLFNHSCGTTLSVWAKEFIDLYNGPVFNERATGGENCRGYCLDRDNLEFCPAQCECACVRNVAGIIRSWPKKHRISP